MTLALVSDDVAPRPPVIPLVVYAPGKREFEVHADEGLTPDQIVKLLFFLYSDFKKLGWTAERTQITPTPWPDQWVIRRL